VAGQFAPRSFDPKAVSSVKKFRVGLQEMSPHSPVTTLQWLDVSDLEELKRTLAEKGIRQVGRESHNMFDERFTVGEPVAVGSLTQSAWEWLVDESNNELHCLTYEP
jgi:hypothetical protein